MTVKKETSSQTWTFVDGDWHEGNVPLFGARTHAVWLGSTVFDGARWFEGVAPDLDLHCKRVNRSAVALGLKPTVDADEMVDLTHQGLKRFDGNTAVYIRPSYWAEDGGYMAVPADPDSTRFALTLFESPMIAPQGFSVGFSPFRRPTPETMPTEAKAGCLYPQNGRAILEAKSRGFDNCITRDMLGNVCETGTSNIFFVKDGQLITPAANGCFLTGITRKRIMGLLDHAGMPTIEKTVTMDELMDADEIFSTGNHSKVVPIIRIEDRELQPGPVAKKARDLYWEWAKSA
ncbi:MAG: branched-chain amino acid aminotransferase [Pseudomonadota bacterium]